MGDSEKGTKIMKFVKKIWRSLPPVAQFWLVIAAVLLFMAVPIVLGSIFGWELWGPVAFLYVMLVAVCTVLLSTGDFDRKNV